MMLASKPPLSLNSNSKRSLSVASGGFDTPNARGVTACRFGFAMDTATTAQHAAATDRVTPSIDKALQSPSRLVWDQEAAGSNPVAPTFQPAADCPRNPALPANDQRCDGVESDPIASAPFLEIPAGGRNAGATTNYDHWPLFFADDVGPSGFRLKPFRGDGAYTYKFSRSRWYQQGVSGCVTAESVAEACNASNEYLEAFARGVETAIASMEVLRQGALAAWQVQEEAMQARYSRRLDQLERSYRPGQRIAVEAWRAVSKQYAAAEPPPALAGIKHIRRFECEACHVYFLTLGDEVVYVGQSVNGVASRVPDHGDKQFDRVFFIEVDRRSLNHTEQHWIRKLRPRFNRAHKPEEARNVA